MLNTGPLVTTGFEEADGPRAHLEPPRRRGTKSRAHPWTRKDTSVPVAQDGERPLLVDQPLGIGQTSAALTPQGVPLKSLMLETSGAGGPAAWIL